MLLGLDTLHGHYSAIFSNDFYPRLCGPANYRSVN